MNSRIVVVEDDPKTIHLIKLYLENAGYHVYTANTGQGALALVRQVQPDLVILDLMLPRVDGLEVCRILHQESDVPVIMLTARAGEDDKLRGLEMGADDYITKPFSPREVVARVKAVLRRSHSNLSEGLPALRFGNLLVDFVRHEVWHDGHRVYLTPREFRLLEIMMRHPGRAFTRSQLLEHAFGLDYEGLERTIDVHVKNLRKKIEPNPLQPVYVQTVYGIGYKFTEQNA